jgi:hypothetical protein
MNTEPVLLSAAIPVNLFNLPHSNKIELTLSVLLTDTPLARPSSIVHRLDVATCRWSVIREVTLCLERNSFLHSTGKLYISQHGKKRKKERKKERKKKKTQTRGKRRRMRNMQLHGAVCF